MPVKNILSVKVNKNYVSNNESFVSTVSNVSLDLKEGQIHGILGRRNSGKEVLFDAISNRKNDIDALVIFNNEILASGSKKTRSQKKEYGNSIQIIRPNPLESINGSKKIRSILKEPIYNKNNSEEELVDITKDWGVIVRNYSFVFKENLLQYKIDYYRSETDIRADSSTDIRNQLSSFNIDNFSNPGDAFSYVTSIYYRTRNTRYIKQFALLETFEKKISNLFFEKQLEARSGTLTNVEHKLLKTVRDFEEHKRIMESAKNFEKIIKTIQMKQKRKQKQLIKNTKYNILSFYNDYRMNQRMAFRNSLFVSDQKKYFTLILNNTIYKKCSNLIRTFAYKNLMLTDLEVIELANNIREFVKLETAKLLKKMNITDIGKIIKQIKNLKLDFSNKYVNLSKENEKKNARPYAQKIKKMKIEKFEGKYDYAPSRYYVLQHNLRVAEENFNKYQSDNLHGWEKKYGELVRLHDEVLLNTKSNVLAGKENQNTDELNILIDSIKTKFINHPELKESIQKMKNFRRKNELKFIRSIKDIRNFERRINQFSELMVSVKGINNISKLRKKLRNFINDQKMVSALENVGLTRNLLDSKPLQLTLVQMQQLAIAKAIIAKPKIIIADEILAHLDVSAKARITKLLVSIVRKNNFSMIFFGKDFSKVKSVSDIMSIMTDGKIIESGAPQQLIKNPIHPHTKLLFRSSKGSTTDISVLSSNETMEIPQKILKQTAAEQHFYSNNHWVLATRSEYKKWIK